MQDRFLELGARGLSKFDLSSYFYFVITRFSFFVFQGEFVVEYSGDLVDTGAAKERENQYSLDVSTGCYMYYFKHKGKQYW